MAQLKLVIGNKNLSSWSLRPWLLLKHADIPFEEHVFLFEEDGWRDRIVKLSPSRKVPALRDGDDTVIWDSLAIAEYVNDLFPEKQLWPEDVTARAIARAVSAEMHSSFGNLRKDMSMDVTARVTRRVASAETRADIDRIQALWRECRERFGKSGPFLFGRFSIADAMYAPVVWRFRTYDVELRNAVAAEYQKMMLELPAMKAWEKDAEEEVRLAGTRPRGFAPDPSSAQHCFAVIFSSQHRGEDLEAYGTLAKRMVELAQEQPGFLGIESARGEDGFGITVSYWDSLEAIANWKAQAEHRKAQAYGKSFYERYEVRVCSVERGYKFPRQ